MSEQDTPQLYLVTPPQVELSSFPDRLARVLDGVEVACLRIALASTDEDTVTRACDAIRPVAHDRDVPVVIAEHAGLVERLGLDGVHLLDGARSVRKLRKYFGADPIIGAFCGTSRHDGMNAGEAGADYVAFGPVRATGLGHADPADPELFTWWSEMIEVPVVAEGGWDLDTARELSGAIDFICLGEEVWNSEDTVASLRDYERVLR